MDTVIKSSGGKYSEVDKALGFDKGHFETGHGLVRIDVFNPLKLNARLPSGNEYGANEHFIPGGYTDGGSPECVSDLIPNNEKYRNITFLDNFR